MKISKKLFAVASAAAILATGAFMSCSSSGGDDAKVAVSVTGNKEDTTFSIHGPKFEDGEKAYSDGYNKDDPTAGTLHKYTRYYKQIGTSEKIAEVKTKVTIKKDGSILTKDISGEIFNVNAGFFFNFNEYKDDVDSNKYMDMCVFAFQPAQERAYIEHYNKVDPKNKGTDSNGLGFTDESSLDPTSGFTNTDNITKPTGTKGSSWVTVTKGTHYAEDDAAYTYYIIVKQPETGKYDIYMSADGTQSNSNKLGTWDATGGKAKGYTTKEINGKTYAVGAIGVYGTAGQGTNASEIRYETDKNDVTGTLFAETTEE